MEGRLKLIDKVFRWRFLIKCWKFPSAESSFSDEFRRQSRRNFDLIVENLSLMKGYSDLIEGNLIIDGEKIATDGRRMQLWRGLVTIDGRELL
jgi:hypothetical protein